MGRILKVPPLEVIKYAENIAINFSDCDRLKVGAVLWLPHNNGIIATGYNRAPEGSSKRCSIDGHLMVDGHCMRAAHAEQVCLAEGYDSIHPAFMHVTHIPCPHCIKMLIEFNIRQVTWSENYHNASGAIQILEESKLKWGKV